MTGADHISVCVCTYRRIVLLERLLRNLARQETGGRFEYSVVVVDNDAGGSARETVARVAAELKLEVIYSIETVRTIPAARNHALRLARGNYIAIIDDDEFPPPGWLLALFGGISTFNASGTLGPAYPIYAHYPPKWIKSGNMHERPRHRTGTLLQWQECFTSNVLIKAEVVTKSNVYFDMRFKTGGSDQDFFRRAIELGYCFVWVEEGPVYEVMPPERCSVDYFIRRAAVNGFNATKYLQGSSMINQSRVGLKSLAAIVLYALAAPVAACLGWHRLINCVVKGSYHLSHLCGLAGVELWKKRDF